ncbi:MAG: methylmalonyl-CoA mutase, partial [Ignavibacteriales bacterium]|nr:methylmalonyl-CoA mutase [Ignavibacteriales bacterium]
MNNSLQGKKKRWEAEKVNPSVQKLPERKRPFQTDSGIEIERLYTPEEHDYEKRLGFPGEYPFT